ncbi:MAG: hypothetical protein Q8R22_02410 [Flavobacterium sp.]|uniref:hypothetical protein n=1 Tax=Flavobacterium sp. TaxID=239 RepID=UPI00273460B4|nr:hypothetical protein [Flavobacterium sp.]MDP3679670.1 hypothetical protein [Flavobacterium sp.]MDZ4329336.1 hypothetical protein [Flavobacterium sp.]
MKEVQLLNVPNFYSSYYLLGLNQEYKVKFKMEKNFIKFNNKPILIFKVNNTIAVIDNNDPTGIHQELYEMASVYFVTNKLIDHDSYRQPKVKPLYPHYPVNIAMLYCRVFGLDLFRYLKLKDLVQQIYILLRRPLYVKHKKSFKKDNFIFFSSNIWKKEPETNQIRAEFIRFCKADSRITFKGGFIPRSDGNTYGFDNELNEEKYSPKLFSKLSASSKIALNNPAVCGAVSWRLAEYLNQGLFVLSFPFKIELPQNFKQDTEVHFIEHTMEYKALFDKIIDDTAYHNVVAANGKIYFDAYCTPQAQAKYVVDLVLNDRSDLAAV